MSDKKDFNKKYEKTIENLHVELVKMQEWVIQEKKKIALIFEGRDFDWRFIASHSYVNTQSVVSN